uniref:Uncharacterized protein n=1 Tax=Aegilops tauschii TaxID=37682 RepID=M8BXJ7_AEGTA
MASLATALTATSAVFSNDLTYVPGMAPRSANQSALVAGGMQLGCHLISGAAKGECRDIEPMEEDDGARGLSSSSSIRWKGVGGVMGADPGHGMLTIYLGRVSFKSVNGLEPLKNLNGAYICNDVAIAKIMEATLILPVLKQDQIWKDQA